MSVVVLFTSTLCCVLQLNVSLLTAKSKFNDQLFVNKNTQSPNILKFHPYEPHLSVVSKSSVRWLAMPTVWCLRCYSWCHLYSIWDLEQGSKLHSFNIDGKVGVKITAMDYINPHDITFLLTGSGIYNSVMLRNFKLWVCHLYHTDDGVVRVWRNYTDPTHKPQLVATWRAIHNILPTNKSKPYKCLLILRHLYYCEDLYYQYCLLLLAVLRVSCDVNAHD